MSELEVAAAAAPQNVNTDPTTEGILNDGGIDQLIADSPIVGNDANVQGEPHEAAETAAEETPESTTGTPTGDIPKVKLGEQEYTHEELLQAIKIKTDYGDWEKRLRNQSQIVGKLSDEDIANLVPYARGQKEIPKDADPKVSLTKAIMNELFKEDTLTLKDADGIDQEVKIDQLVPFIENIVNAVQGRYTPVINNLENTANQAREEYVTRQLGEFMTTKSEFKIVPPQGISLKEHLQNVYATGQLHPDHVTLTRFNALLDVMDHSGFKTLDETYNFMYGKSSKDVEDANRRSKAAEDLQNKILKNQSGIIPETPTKTPSSELDSDDLFIESLGDDGTSVLIGMGAL